MQMIVTLVPQLQNTEDRMYHQNLLIILCSLGQSQIDDTLNYKTNMRCQYYELLSVYYQYYDIIDNILMEMNRRFKQTELIEAMEACNPKSKMYLDFNTFLKLPGISTDNQFLEKLKAQCDLGKKMFAAESNAIEVYVLIKDMGASFLELEEVFRRILVIPVSSATTEWIFSTMRRVKPYNRSTMIGNCLHNLALLSIEREKSEELILNSEDI